MAKDRSNQPGNVFDKATTLFYYLTASYNMPDLRLEDDTILCGPFVTRDDRDKAIDADLGERDLETNEVVNVTLLRVEDGKLVRESSHVAEEDGSDE